MRGSGGDHEGMEDLVEPERTWPRVRVLPRVDDRADRVEHAAGAEQNERRRLQLAKQLGDCDTAAQPRAR